MAPQVPTTSKINDIIPNDKAALQATLKTENATTLNIVPSRMTENIPSKEQTLNLKESQKTPEDTDIKPKAQTSPQLFSY